jgi:hypothetical protein
MRVSGIKPPEVLDHLIGTNNPGHLNPADHWQPGQGVALHWQWTLHCTTQAGVQWALWPPVYCRESTPFMSATASSPCQWLKPISRLWGRTRFALNVSIVPVSHRRIHCSSTSTPTVHYGVARVKDLTNSGPHLAVAAARQDQKLSRLVIERGHIQ